MTCISCCILLIRKKARLAKINSVFSFFLFTIVASGFAKKKHPHIANAAPEMRLREMLQASGSIIIDTAEDKTTERPVARPFRTLSVYLITDATRSPPNANVDICTHRIKLKSCKN